MSYLCVVEMSNLSSSAVVYLGASCCMKYSCSSEYRTVCYLVKKKTYVLYSLWLSGKKASDIIQIEYNTGYLNIAPDDRHASCAGSIFILAHSPRLHLYTRLV